MAHIKKISFCGIRRINDFTENTHRDPFEAWKGDPERQWLNFGKINVFLGANGGGKSTILELIDAIREPNRLASLSRENSNNNQLSAYEIHFDNNMSFHGRSWPTDLPGQPYEKNAQPNLFSTQCIQLWLTNKTGWQYKIFQSNVSKVSLDPASSTTILSALTLYCQCRVSYWNGITAPSIATLVTALNKAAHLLPGISATGNFNGSAPPFEQYDAQRLAVYLSDDLWQPNLVHIDALPRGWRQIASVLDWLDRVPKGAVCLLEEPDAHLHPKLQRHLAREIDRIANDPERDLQLFITSHSTAIQQPNVWSSAPSVFEATSKGIEVLTSPWRLMDALGIRGSDILQSNGIIWVEGPSDRLYIKHWLHLYCKEHNHLEPKENVDYSFNFYGGPLLSHFRPDEQKDFVAMLRINRNLLLVMDKDLDFTLSQGKLIALKPTGAKAQVKRELERIFPGKEKVWITDGYTMESYLEPAFRVRYFISKLGRLLLNKSTKVEIAHRYTQEYEDFRSTIGRHAQLHTHIERLFNTIESWSH